MKRILSAILFAVAFAAGATEVSVTNIVCAQRYPWNGMVDIDYEVVCDDPDADVWVYATGYDGDMNVSMAPRALSGDGADGPVKAGKHRLTWNVTADYPGFASTAFSVKMCALVGGAPYMVIDLSGGVDALSYPVSYLDCVPDGGWTDEYKGDKLVLRLIPPGTFMMGSPSDELGREPEGLVKETIHPVTLTKPFYIGLFEVTQRQYELVMGSNPSYYKGNTRPVECISYNMIRGTVNGAAWPAHNQVDANSFMGRLRTKANMLFDLPTEAQWEYACRAGTGTALNSGKNLVSMGRDTSMAEVGRYRYNNYNDEGGTYWDGKSCDHNHCEVGSYLPNAWGLYDMHGNVWEWCRDWHMANLGSASSIDPNGVSSGSDRVTRGGSWSVGVEYCRSAIRGHFAPVNYSGNDGFRVACLPAD